jgi:hypothetical protein
LEGRLFALESRLFCEFFAGRPIYSTPGSALSPRAGPMKSHEAARKRCASDGF